ncbi:MAG TPA: outer membrane beta-barrel protein [Steroidobacteraceae bacterium]|nr:outer membrane beta-barrel protein [Steroidobacteraceae bacterium]
MSRLQALAATAVCAGLLLHPTRSHADVASEGPISGPYVGGAFGRFDLRLDNFNDVGAAVDDITHSTHDAYRIDAGWRFLPFLAIEADYMNFGSAHDSFVGTGSNGDYNLHMSGFAPFVVGTLPLGPLEIFAKGGYLFYNTNLTVDFNEPPADVLQSSHSRSDFIYGGGLGLTLFGHLNFNAEYDQIRMVNAPNSNALWLGAAWRF